MRGDSPEVFDESGIPEDGHREKKPCGEGIEDPADAADAVKIDSLGPAAYFSNASPKLKAKEFHLDEDRDLVGAYAELFGIDRDSPPHPDLRPTGVLVFTSNPACS